MKNTKNNTLENTLKNTKKNTIKNTRHPPIFFSFSCRSFYSDYSRPKKAEKYFFLLKQQKTERYQFDFFYNDNDQLFMIIFMIGRSLRQKIRLFLIAAKREIWCLVFYFSFFFLRPHQVRHWHRVPDSQGWTPGLRLRALSKGFQFNG